MVSSRVWLKLLGAGSCVVSLALLAWSRNEEDIADPAAAGLGAKLDRRVRAQVQGVSHRCPEAGERQQVQEGHPAA